MEITYKNNNIILTNQKDFDISHIFDCGQCFRFNKLDTSSYMGIAFGKVLKLSQTENEIILHDTNEKDFYDIWYDFLDLSVDYGKIKKSLCTDSVMQSAVKCGNGIRILRQDLWETIVSFIISQSNNIPRIKGIIERLCLNFGEPIEYMGNVYYSFPSIERIASLTLDELAVIRAGFRDKYILNASKAFQSGEMSLDLLSSLPTPEAKRYLTELKGIGNKVSDCILLFGMGRTDSFPVDVWIKRIMEYCYFDNEQSIKTISSFAEEKFGVLGGYAQQYLFFYARENKIGI